MNKTRLFPILALLAWSATNGRAQTVITPPQMGCPAVNYAEMIIARPTADGFRFGCYPLPAGWTLSGNFILPAPFKTNGVPNASQAQLNIVGGPNCSATNTTGGTVSINCSGGGGGGGGNYFFTATTSPQSIAATSVGGSTGGVPTCLSGPLTFSVATGDNVPCLFSRDVTGNLTVYYTSGEVGSIQVSTGGGGGGGGSFPAGANLIKQTAVPGVGADSGIVPANVIQSTGSYSNPGWITALAAAKITGMGGTCTNQAVTAISATATPTCATITSAFINTTIARTGGDLSTAIPTLVTHTTLAAPLPIAQGGTGTATPSLVAGTNVAISGTWPNQTISATGGGGGGAGTFYFAATTSPQTILASSLGSSVNGVPTCFDGALSGGVRTGNWVPCLFSATAGGNLTVYYTAGEVLSIQVDTGGGGGGGGLADPGANGVVYRTSLNVTAPATSAQIAAPFTGCSSGVPLLSWDGTCRTSVFGTGYAVNAGANPMTITAATHGQGTNPEASCWSGSTAVDGGGNNVTTGTKEFCIVTKDPSGNGNLVISWGGSLGSIQVMPGSGTGGGGGGGGMVYPGAGVAVSTGSAWTTSLQTGTSAGNLVVLNGSAQLPAVSGENLTALPNFAVRNNSNNTGTSGMTLDMSASSWANAFRVPVAASLTTTANGAIGYDSTANALHAALNSLDAFVALFTATPANGDCVNWVVVGGVTKLGTTGSACGSGGGGSAFSAITGGTNTTAAMVVGTGASISATGSGTIAATSVAGFTPGAGTLTGPGSALTLTASGGVMTNSTLGNAATAAAFDHNPTDCTNQWATAIDAGGNLTCSDITRLNGTLLSGLSTGILKVTTGTGAVSVAVAATDYAPATTGSSILKASSGGFANAVASDVAALGTLSNNTTGTANVALVANALSGQYIDWAAGSGPTSIANKPSIPTVTGGTCTNQVVTAISSSAVPTCTTITSAYVNTSIAQTGVDINTSFQVTATHLASALPIAQGGTGTTTPGLVAGSGISISGTWPNQTITNTGGGGGGVTSVTGTSPIASSGGTTPAISCPTCVTGSSLTSGRLLFGGGSQAAAVGDLTGYIKTGGTSAAYLYADIRNYGATCNGTDQHTAVLAALNAGLKEIYIPSGCNWTLPTSAWSYTVSGTTYPVLANAIPAGLKVAGQNWLNSTVTSTTNSLYVGPATVISNLNIPNANCQKQNPSTGVYGSTTTCPTGILTNEMPIYTGTVNTSGTTVTWVTGDTFVTNATGNNWLYWGPTYNNAILTFVINGTAYTVDHVVSSTSLVLTSSAGTQSGVAYSALQYMSNPELMNTTLYINSLGPQDGNGIHVEANSGDGIYSAAHGTMAAAFRGAIYENGGVVYLANRHANAPGFEVVDISSDAFDSPAFYYQTSYLTGGRMFSISHDTSTFNGDAISMSLGEGTGSFTGKFIKANNAGSTKFAVDSVGRTDLFSIRGTTSGIAGNVVNLGLSSDTNFFFDREAAGGQIILGYNTPQSSGSLATGIFQVYNHSSTGQKLLFKVNSAGGTGGQDGVVMPNLPTSCSGQATGTIYNTTTSATGGGTALGVCP